MNRVVAAPADLDWRVVSEVRPCPICAGHSDCKTHAQDEFASCARTPSQWPLTNGSWLHRLKADPDESGRLPISRVRSTASAANTSQIGSSGS